MLICFLNLETIMGTKDIMYKRVEKYSMVLYEHTNRLAKNKDVEFKIKKRRDVWYP